MWGGDTEDTFRKMVALLRFYYPREDVDNISDDRFGKLWSELIFCLKFARDLRDNDLK